MVALALITNETPAWDVLDTFPKLHSRAREVKTTACTEVPHSKSLDRVEIWLTIYETCDRLESFTRDPIGFDGDSLDLYEFVVSRPLDSIDPSGLTSFLPGIGGGGATGGPPGGTGKQQHHFFPVAKRGAIDALCKALGFSIDEFTLLVQGNVARGSEHWWYQYGCGNYNRKVQDILNRTNNCCDFMREMVELINNTHACVARGMGRGTIPPIMTFPYGEGPPNNWPGGQTLIDLVCNSKLPCVKKPFPLPKSQPVIIPGIPPIIPLAPPDPVPMPDEDPYLPPTMAPAIYPGLSPVIPINSPRVVPTIIRILPRVIRSPSLLPI